jgi:SOS-response transcriptional repressor LexA
MSAPIEAPRRPPRGCFKKTVGLTAHQARIVVFMREFQLEHGTPPTLRQIGARFELRSTHAVWDMLKRLQRKGVVTHEPGAARGWRVVVPAEDDVASAAQSAHEYLTDLAEKGQLSPAGAVVLETLTSALGFAPEVAP